MTAPRNDQAKPRLRLSVFVTCTGFVAAGLAIVVLVMATQPGPVAMGISVLVLMAAAVFFRQGLSTPLRRIAETAAALAAGDCTAPVAGTARRDEIGRIARATQAVQEHVSQVTRDTRESMMPAAGFSAASTALMMIDAEGVVTHANPALRSIWAGDDPTQQAITDIWPDLAEIVGWLEAPEAPLSSEIRLEGALYALCATAVRDAAGMVLGAVIEITDVTQSRLNAAVLAALDANQVRADFDAEGKFLSANEGLWSMAGTSTAELSGRSMDTMLACGDPDWRMALSRGKAVFGIFEVVGASGQQGKVDGGLVPVLDSRGEVTRIILLGKDITQTDRALQNAEAERHELEAQQQLVVDTIRQSLKQLSNGDLTVRIETQFSENHKSLRMDFNDAMEKLERALGEVSTNANAITGEAGDISSAADDLSKRTEHQAATLEETAAALAQITASVSSAAQGAQNANTVVTEARQYAEQSGDVVREAVAAMGEIEASSDQISRIIGVIDDIAFQTNLLALNAGVEAARAGDAGRGFAVVASEVRALAQRSSEAAREINGLISASGSHVKRGVELVGNAGDALERIVDSVGGIAAHVGDIAASAKEQATGLDEINSAMSQLDQVTQQNAAMFEETTAASHALSREAEALRATMGRFSISPIAGAAAAAGMFTRAADRPIARPPTSTPAQTPTAAPPQSAGLALAEAEVEIDDDWEDF